MALILEELHQETRIAMTYDEFLSQIDEDAHAEWVNGETILFMPPTPQHQSVVTLLILLLRGFVGHLNLGQVLTSPIEMKVSPDANAREPDILFVANEHLHYLSDKKLEGPADLVIEVISPESVSRDRSDKFYEYQQSGIREYWIIDPRAGFERADFWVLDEEGQYQPIPLDDSGTYHSTVIPGFWLKASWLANASTQDGLKELAQIIGPENLIAAIQNTNGEES